MTYRLQSAMSPDAMNTTMTSSLTDEDELSEERKAGLHVARAPPGEEICITGIAGKFPDSEDMHELRDNLFAKRDLITCDSRRWDVDKVNPATPKYLGKINGLSKFDAGFFGIHCQQSHASNPMVRMLLEKTYEAIVDAGVNPMELRGTRTGVFVGSCYSESDPRIYKTMQGKSGQSLLGSLRVAFAPRIAYWLRTNGPCYTVDTACSSSLYALDHAFRAIRDGHCDQAIVGGVNLALLPNMALQFFRLGVLSPDCRCKTFDNAGDGYARSEAIVVVYVQKAKDARRNYANVVYTKGNNDGFKGQGITYPSGQLQQQLLTEFYKECETDPASVAWMEAHGTGTAVGDPEECNAIASVFCAGRREPLPIGSIKSNMGHSEPASGLCSVAKVVIAMETGLIPPNINYRNPNQKVSSLLDGRLQVVTEPQPWDGGLVGINSFGFGGANAHVCLKWNAKAKVDGGQPADALPRLVAISGRTREGVERMFLDLESRPVDAELVRLYHAVHATEIPAHVYRGYAVLAAGKCRHHVQRFDRRRSVWLAFPEATGDWRAAGSALLALPPFARAIADCDHALAPAGLRLRQIFTDGAPDNPLDRALAVTAVQIGLVAVLRAAGVEPRGLLGVGSGQLAAGYADGCLTAEQAVLAAYAWGTWLCGDGKATSDGAGHERTLFEQLQQIVPSPKPRSPRWVGGGSVRVASAQFVLGSLTSPAQLEDVLKLASDDAVIVEVAATAAAARSSQNVSLAADIGGGDAVDALLNVLGKLFEMGANLQLANLYPAVAFPVSRTTPMISPLVSWQHSRDWHVGLYEDNGFTGAREAAVEISTELRVHEFYKGHVIDGRNLFPATGYLFLAWELQNDNAIGHQKCVFEDVRFHRATNLPVKGSVELLVIIQKVSGRFEVIEGGVPVVTGRISTGPSDGDAKEVQIPTAEQYVATTADSIEMDARDIYKELRLRGYDYSGVFRSLVSADATGRSGKIRWVDENWVAFMDNMLQMQILSSDTRGLFVPTAIERLTIDKPRHQQKVEEAAATAAEGGYPVLDVCFYKDIGVVRAGGIEIWGLEASAINRKKHLAEPVLEKYNFLPDQIGPESDKKLSLHEALRVCVHVGLENNAALKVKAVELLDKQCSRQQELLVTELARLLGELPLVQADLCVVLADKATDLPEDLSPNVRVERRELDDSDGGALFVIASRLLHRADLIRAALGIVGSDGFVIAREEPDREVHVHSQLELLNEYHVGDEKILLLRQRRSLSELRVVCVREGQDGWIEELQRALPGTKGDQRVVLVSQGEPLNGLLGMFNCLRKEPGGENARCFLLDAASPPFDSALPLYRDRLAKDLAVNALREGRWGSHRHLPLPSNADVAAPHAYANVTTRGDLASFRWLEGPLDPASLQKGPLQELVHVYSAALNFRDVMIATGRLAAEVVAKKRMDQDCVLGLEFSGRTAAGRRVMGMLASGALSTLVLADAELLWDVPDDWSLADAATVPIVYGTALYALQKIGGMRRGDTVLIHAGSGGVGQAAIQLALHAGAVVFTTVGTAEKHAFIREHFPQVSERNIGNSRDTSFEQLVMRETGGRGVDLVLNSLAEEKLQASLRCLAVGGRFLEIGKFDLAANNLIDMQVFLKETSFHGVMLDSLFVAGSEQKRQLHAMLAQSIRDGAVRPLTRTVFPTEEVEQAFRFMGAGKHIGKVLLNVRSEEQERSIVPELLLRKASPRFSCHPQRSYIITGGLGGFGLELADWLVLRGARHLVLVSRSGLRTGYQAARVRTWRSYGVEVRVSVADIETESGVVELLTAANAMAPVAGIFNLAVVLRDAMFANQTGESFAAAAGPKSTAARLLDVASRRLCPLLAHFVAFSSVSCGRGNAGQTSYGAANAVMERVCERRAALGLPALAVQWGAVGQVGLVANMRDDDKEVVIGGTLPQRISSCLAVLDGFLRQAAPVVASMVVAEKLQAGGAASMVECIAGILGIGDMKTVSFQTTLAELGMDSMTAVEIKQTLEREYQVFLTPVEIRGLTLGRVAEISEASKDADAELSDSDGNVAVPATNADMLSLLRGLGDESQAYAATVTLASAQSDADAPTVLVVPGIEGAAASLAPLAANLRARVVCLQGEFLNDPCETVQGIAEKLLPLATNELVPGAQFCLVGYSFGGMVAIQMAALLERDGRRGTVTLIDGAPDFVASLVSNVYADGSEDTLQTNLLVAILNIVQEQNSDVLEMIRTAILKLGTWEERLQYAISLMSATVEYSPLYQEDATNLVLRRIRAAIGFTWTDDQTLESPVTLLRPIYRQLKMAKDCGVSKFCRLPVDVHLFDADHVSILATVAVATIINNQLGQ